MKTTLKDSPLMEVLKLDKPQGSGVNPPPAPLSPVACACHLVVPNPMIHM